MLTNSLYAGSEDRDITTTFCRSSFGSRNSRSFSAGFSGENTFLSLIMLSSSANSQDREAQIGIRRMFGPRSSSDPRTHSWRIQFVSGPLTRFQTLSSRGHILRCLHLLAFKVVVSLQGVGSNCLQQHGDLSRNGFFGHLLRGDIQFKSLNPPSPLFERVPLKLQESHSKHVLFREPCLFLCFSKAGLVARQHVRVTNVTKQTPVAWFYVYTMTEKVKT